MRILLVTPYFPPQNAVASLRVHAFARRWADRGEDVTVLTTLKRSDQQGLDLSREGFRVVELGCRAPAIVEWARNRHKAESSLVTTAGRAASSSGPRRPFYGALRRLRDSRGIYASVRMPDVTDHWVRPASRWARQHGPWDVVVSSSGPYTAHLAALPLRREGVARAWATDFRDLWTDNHLYPGLFPFTARERAGERRCLAAADLVTTVSDGLARRLRAKTRAPVEVILNGIDARPATPRTHEPILPVDGRARLVYTGTLYEPGQDPRPLFEALARLKRPAPAVVDRLRLVVAGEGAARWTELAREFRVEPVVEIRGVVPRAEALRMQLEARGLVIFDWRDPDEGVLTGKLFEYLGATAPIFVIGGRLDSPIARVVLRSGRGFHLGDRSEAIARALEQLVGDDPAMQVSRDEEYLATLTRDAQCGRLLELIRALPRRAARAT